MGLSVYLACLFSKIWNTRIQLMYIKTFMRTLLMSLSANFTFMSVLSLHQMINLFPHYELHFPASLHVYYFFFFLDWMPDVVHFALLSDIHIFVFL